MNRLLSTIAMMVAAISGNAKDVTVSVSNPSDFQRQELAEIDTNGLGITPRELVVENAVGQQVDYQITYDGKLLFEVNVRPKQTINYYIKKGVPKQMRQWVKGAKYPTRKDDVAWENDRGAYRVYGPPLQRSGERAFGIDVWTKNTPDLVLDKRFHDDYIGNVYKDDFRRLRDWEAYKRIDHATNFHLDLGNGLDCYGVGPSLGGGAPALLTANGTMAMPYCYRTFRILDNGPLRFTVELEYNPAKIDGDTAVIEHRLISLDKGSNYNHMTVWYTGLSKSHDVVGGIVLHDADKSNVVIEKGIALYADPTEQPAMYGFSIFTGLIFPDGAKTQAMMLDKPDGAIHGHIVGEKSKLKDGERFNYYFGSAWSSFDCHSLKEWQIRSEEKLKAIQQPLSYNL